MHCEGSVKTRIETSIKGKCCLGTDIEKQQWKKRETTYKVTVQSLIWHALCYDIINRQFSRGKDEKTEELAAELGGRNKAHSYPYD